ncbi:hypothetical protein BCY91_11720 [Pelobium manganitolerans]|uniref:HNH nuclease domain-containing protein n=1 Tax=Pelobium manganitolerans TaxID=1842495 RepID=A0A419S2F1_9SPHI|nr:HNH endonuclease [Pelobium manganitolerans]RKD12900.1 hypothetical protein BCY91_11720 [Pelobium manganitolerans]
MTKCPKCDSALSEVDKKFGTLYSCNKEGCYHEEFNYSKNCCNDQFLKPVKVYKDEFDIHIEPNKFTVYNQCQTCGKKVGTALKKANFQEHDLPLFNENLVNESESERIDLRKELTEIDERKKRARHDDFWDDYTEYLKSERWKSIREIVLRRDNYKCQSCLTEDAVEVHHTIGHFRKNEPIFSLFSVCNRCHIIITEIERGGHRTAEKIIYQFEKEKNNGR